MFAPAKTPPAIVTKLAAELIKAMDTHEVKQLMLITGAETSPQATDEFAAFRPGGPGQVGEACQGAGESCRSKAGML